jgi:hypothetical protein
VRWLTEMSTEDFVVRLVCITIVATLLTILFIANAGLYDGRVDNARIYPILSTLAVASITATTSTLSAWVAFKFGKIAIDRLEDRLREAQAEIASLRAKLEGPKP